MADKMYRTSPRENGKYYAIEYSFDGGKTWYSTGDSSPSQEEANKKMENMKKGLTASGLTKEQAQEQAKDNILKGTSVIRNADPNSKNVLTKEEAAKAGINWRTLPTQYDLEHPNLTGNKTNDSNGWIDSEGNVHLNSRTTEARNDAALEDIKNNRDYRTAQAPSQRELDMRNGNFNTKNADGTYAWSNEELISTRETARKNKDTELETAVQKEINRRYAAGEAPEFNPTPKKEPPKEEPKKVEQKVEQKTEETGNFHVGSNTNGSDFIGGKDDKGGKTPKKSSYWTNFLYGNDKGSVQNDKEAKAEKEKKMDDFLKNNPNLVKAIFGKNSGLNFGERVARLGEMLAMIGADATRGAYAGFNHQALPEATKGRYSEIYNNALKNQYARKQDVFESENKATIDKANRLSILKSSPILSKLDDDMLSQLADKTVTGITEAEWDKYENDLLKKGYKPQEIEEIKSTFNTLRNTFSDITTQRGNVVELNGKEFDLMRKPQQAIAELRAQKAKLNEQLVQVRTLKYDQLKSFLQSFKSTYAGIQSVSNSMSENKEFGYNASTSVRGGIPVVGGSISGGVNGGNGSAKSTGTNTDELALEGLQTGKIAAEEWDKDTDTYRRLLEDSIKEAIKEIDNQISTLEKFHSIDDGIVKAPHMKQWLVREDGTRIALNPSDSIYATKNKLTTKKDNKSENVVPMEKEDKVVVIQKKLGHNGDKRIIKQNDYYLSKLK
jgi:hypothetical protein